MAKGNTGSNKEIVDTIKRQEKEQNEIAKQKILNASEEILDLIKSLSVDYPNGIPYTKINEKTGYSYDLIQVSIMHLIMTKSIIGFINDRSTSDLSDDILILREKRIIDELEGSYRTG